MARFCNNCGKPIREGAKFCLVCGTAVIDRTPVPESGWSARANDPELLSRVEGKGLLSLKSLGRRMTGRGEDYEGTVVDKHTVREQYDPEDYGFEHERGKKRSDYYIEHGITIIQTTTGKKQEIKEDLGGLNLSGPRVWNMLQVGDRVRYHSKFAFPYELYDKSRLSYLYCACCSAKNDIKEDRCRKCGAPLLK